MKRLSQLVLLAIFGLQCSCTQAILKEKTYLATGGQTLNGAKVNSAVKPMGGEAGMSFSAMVYSAAAGSLDGPFLWRIEAEGEEGVHESLIVHRLSVHTEKTGREEPFPGKWLGIKAPFEPYKDKKKAGKVFAKFQPPGKLEVFPEEDGEIEVKALVSVKTKTKTERGELTFKMVPSSKRKVETVFLPSEVVKSFGKKDPTQWAWPKEPLGSTFDSGF